MNSPVVFRINVSSSTVDNPYEDIASSTGIFTEGNVRRKPMVLDGMCQSISDSICRKAQISRLAMAVNRRSRTTALHPC